MTPEEMRRAASLLDAAPSAYERVPGEHSALARLLREQADATGWQPIETAPRDGTRLLLYSVHRRRIADGEFGNYRVWSWPYVMVEPTHWQPLPPGPEA